VLSIVEFHSEGTAIFPKAMKDAFLKKDIINSSIKIPRFFSKTSGAGT
jgi:hypothetical protein